MANDNDLGNTWGEEQTPFVGTTPTETSGAASAEGAASSYSEPAAAAGTAAGAGSAAYSSTYGAAGYSTGSGGAPPVAGWGPVGSGYAPPPPGAAMPVSSEPSPGLAFFLGLIPGVGAMYNGQIVKGIVHLIVFSVLVTIANNVNDVFGIFVAGWIFFMAFEAYHTAKARRDGLPLPNAFGWNDIGERMGLGRNWPFSPGASAAVPPMGAAPNAAGAPTPVPPAGWAGVHPVPPVGASPYVNVAPGMGQGFAQGVAPNWAGYVPPTAFASAPPVGSAAGAGVPPGHGVPYAPVNAGAPFAPVTPMDLQPAPSRLPVGAIWLIGLGVLFLLGQWTPLLHVGRVWIPSLLLTGLAGFLFARRMGWTGSIISPATAALPIGLRVAMALRLPGALLAIAILNGLHEAWVVRWHESWPVLLIVVGVLMSTLR